MKFIFLLLSLSIFSCGKNDQSTVKFTGFDARKCGCCWGYEITLGDGSKVKGGKFPANLNLNETTSFPFEGIIEYTKTEGCTDNIDITYFEKVK